MLELHPDLSSERLLFTPNFAPLDEYRAAMQVSGSSMACKHED